MKNEYLIAQRLYYNQGAHQEVRPAIRVALIGMTIGIAVILLTFAVVFGFKNAVTEKVTGFSGHIEVVNFDNNNTYQMQPIIASDSLLERLNSIDGIKHANRFATKPGVMKVGQDIHPIVIKGLATQDEQAWTFFSNNLIKGKLPESKNEVIISNAVARLMHIDTDSAILAYFIGDNIRARKLTVAGIYRTDLTEFDNLFVVGDIRQVQALSGWTDMQVSGIELYVNDFSKLYEVADKVYFAVANQADEEGNFFYTQNIEELQPQIFYWLDLLDMNVVVIIVLMLIVSGFCIISGLIILILESIQFIGTMKALGATNMFIRRVFLWQTAFLVSKGLLIGNIIALVICLVQYYFHVIPLDAATYYVSYVPISMGLTWWLAADVCVLAVSILILLAPSAIITKISPAQVMRYE